MTFREEEGSFVCVFLGLDVLSDLEDEITSSAGLEVNFYCC